MIDKSQQLSFGDSCERLRAATDTVKSPYYEYRHVVGFEETNLTGNVYFVHYLRWQGRCRELFLRDCAPDVLRLLASDFAMVTTRVHCQFFAEVYGLNALSIQMRLADVAQNRITMAFDYWRFIGGEQLVARGEQEIACMGRDRACAGGLSPVSIPAELMRALRPFASGSLAKALATTGSLENS